jgi:ATP-binding cassette subfamily B protein
VKENGPKSATDDFRAQWTATDFRRLFASARWAIRLAWSTNPRLLIGVAVVFVVRGMIPAGLALTARGLVNASLVTIDSGTPHLGLVAPWLLLGFVLTLLEGIGQLASNLFTRRQYDELNFRLTLDMLTHAARLDVAFYDDPRLQDVLQRAQENPAEHVSRFVNDAFGIASNILQAVSLIGVLVFIEPLILLVAVFFSAPYLRFEWRLALQQYAIERARTTKRRWSGYFVSLLTGRASVGEIRMLGLAPLLIEKFRALMSEFHSQDRRMHGRAFAYSSLFVILTTTAIYATFMRVSLRVLSGSLTLGDLAVFGGATTRLRNTMQAVVQSVTGAMQRTLFIANAIDFLAIEPRGGSGLEQPAGGRAVDIELRDVSFTYPDTRERAVDNVSLRIRPGETVAIVGENGAGKTTLVKLIAGLYDVDEGEIRFDGVDISRLSRDSLQQQIACVFQSFGRYEASVAENIAYGNWRKMQADPDRVKEVAALAGVHEMIESLPRGYETLIGRLFGEYDLSGGQWQGIAVARAFARDASLLILDEPTSNLDARAEYNLFRRFHELAKGRTTLIISHRFSTVRVADRILVMEMGRVVESGTHDELMEQEGGYARLYELHSRKVGFRVEG